METIKKDGKTYKLHKVSIGKTPIGLVPVLQGTIEDLAKKYGSATCLEAIESAIAIKLQAQARKTAGGKLTESEFYQIAAKLIAGNPEAYENNFDKLKADVNDAFNKQDHAIDETHIFW